MKKTPATLRITRADRLRRLMMVAAGLSVVAAVPLASPLTAQAVAQSHHAGVHPRTEASKASVVGKACTVKMTGFKFVPSGVPPRGSTTLNVSILNCTNKSFNGEVEIYGLLVCEVLDPFVQKVNLPPRSREGFGMPFKAPNCQGEGKLTGELLTSKGKLLSKRHAVLTVIVG